MSGGMDKTRVHAVQKHELRSSTCRLAREAWVLFYNNAAILYRDNTFLWRQAEMV